ncbi:hypothetical protein T484DRAFT_1847271 [Baffinella frigidus]|nr:hypothetical protein T484DRAFT_1847271 [Cryptophyta sp. CCMP2293]
MAFPEVHEEEARMASKGPSVAARRAMAIAMALACVAAVALLAVKSPERSTPQEDAASFSLGAPQNKHNWFTKVRKQASPSEAFMQATDSAMSAAKDAAHFMLAAAPAPAPPALEPSEAPAAMEGEEEAPAAEAVAEPAAAEPVQQGEPAEGGEAAPAVAQEEPVAGGEEAAAPAGEPSSVSFERTPDQGAPAPQEQGAQAPQEQGVQAPQEQGAQAPQEQVYPYYTYMQAQAPD